MTRGAIILCGGLSSRMGRAKALLPWRGATMLQHVTGVLEQTVDEVIIVASAELALPPLRARIVRDRAPHLGPLAGIREGLEALRADLAFATGTDAPYLTPEFVNAMLAFGVAAAPVADGFVQCLSAAYPKSLASLATELLAQNRMSLHGLLEAANFRRVLPAELPDVRAIRGFNTPEEYLAAVRSEPDAAAVAVELRSQASVASFETQPATLRDILRAAEARGPALRLMNADVLSSDISVKLSGAVEVSALNMPVGPGERVTITDAQ